MAQYYSDSDTDSYGSCDGDEYSNVDFGVHSLVSFGSSSIYQLPPLGSSFPPLSSSLPPLGRGEEEEDEIYEMVGMPEDELYAHRFYGKVGQIEQKAN